MERAAWEAKEADWSRGKAEVMEVRGELEEAQRRVKALQREKEGEQARRQRKAEEEGEREREDVEAKKRSEEDKERELQSKLSLLEESKGKLQEQLRKREEASKSREKLQLELQKQLRVAREGWERDRTQLKQATEVCALSGGPREEEGREGDTPHARTHCMEMHTVVVSMQVYLLMYVRTPHAAHAHLLAGSCRTCPVWNRRGNRGGRRMSS